VVHVVECDGEVLGWRDVHRAEVEETAQHRGPQAVLACRPLAGVEFLDQFGDRIIELLAGARELLGATSRAELLLAPTSLA
jgi:hypothetical protein